MQSLKLQYTKDMILQIVAKFKKPCLLCSFGKDSMVLLYILRDMGIDVPIVFYRDPYSPKKFDFANAIMSKLDLTVYDYPPAYMGFDAGNGVAHVIHYHNTGGKRTLARALGLVPVVDGKKWHCALNDFIERPLGTFDFPFDVCFHGHKSTDVDPVSGRVELKVDLLNVPESAAFAYPLRYWTDEDVWSYSEENGVPINDGRYQKVDGKWGDVKDKSLNSDYYHACWACIDKEQKEMVFCPKKGTETENVSSKVMYDSLDMDYVRKQPIN